MTPSPKTHAPTQLSVRLTNCPKLRTPERDVDLWIYTQPDFDSKTWNPSNHNFFKLTPDRCRKIKIPKEVLDRLPEKDKVGLRGE